MSIHVPISQQIFSNYFTLHWHWITCAVYFIIINVIHVEAIECGTVHLYREAVLGGNEVIKDEWPFIVALYNSRTFKYFCMGTIISHKHILTAGHCIQTKGKGVPLTPDEVTVRLGAFNLTDRSEKDAINRNVKEIYVHPDWKYNEEKYDADIAILVLNENLTFSNSIRPVCMPPAGFLIDGLNGTVVGWGITENGTAEGTPRKIEMNALNDMHCYETDYGIARYVSERTFCGEGNGTPNEGDSGGGFFAVSGSGWVQFGTVSFIRPKEIGNNLRIALYMKLTSLRDWITEKVEQCGGTISLATTTTDLACTYGSSKQWDYGCWLYDLNIRQESLMVGNFTGSHKSGKGNDDVEMIVFRTGVIASFPRNFGSIFRNLKFLVVTVNTTRIFRSIFENLERLTVVRYANSSIAEIDENSLWDLPNLQSIRVKSGHLKFLHAGTFSRNSKLLGVHILSNALESLPRNLFQNNSLLEAVYFDDNSIEIIDENIFETNANLRVVSLKGNRLSHLSGNLFRNNPKLKFLDLSNNRIDTIDAGSFTANSNLLLLNLAFNELEFLPEQLLQGVESLEAIYLHNNVLNAIDEHFFETNVRITQVLLGSNQLTHIPVNLFRNNSQLTWLEIRENLIGELDGNLFEKNSLLQTISLESNLIVEFPEELFTHNSMLEIVSLSENLPQNMNERLFEWNTKLREVYFSDGRVVPLSGKLFQNNSLLEIVHFGSNSLQVIDEHTFEFNAKLREVNFNWNSLEHLPDNLFRNNPLLQIVDLSANLFTTLNESIFNANPNLDTIYLQNCMLETLPRNLFQGNPRLTYIDLSGNMLMFIEIDFSALKHVSLINLFENDCIDYVFNDASGRYIFKKRTNNIAKFQNLVIDNCKPKIVDSSEVTDHD